VGVDFRFLSHIDPRVLHSTFLQAFSDYVIPMEPSFEQLSDLLMRRGAELNLSIGAFDGDELIGFNLNALDTYRGSLSVYDVATGVIPRWRRRGVTVGMFGFSLPTLRKTGAKNYVLEVIDTNFPAIEAYKSIGFNTSRSLHSFRCNDFPQPRRAGEQISIREVDPEWELFQTFCDWEPSWQNSRNSIQRSQQAKVVLGAYVDNTVVGYGIVFRNSGDIPQFAVKSDYRRQGIGTALLRRLLREVNPACLYARIINIDADAESTLRLVDKLGFRRFLGQLEMQLQL
jgi:ribosomal protein S18 acetylase RimI-like enzyme